MSVYTLLILLGIGLFAGLLSGFVGVGGGIIIVPALVIFLSMSQHAAQGTSLAVLVMPVGIFAVINYYKAGHIDIKSALAIAVSFVVGAYYGSKIAIGLDQNQIKRFFGIFLLAIGLKMTLGK